VKLERPLAHALIVALDDVCAAGPSSSRSEALLGVCATTLETTVEESRRDRTSLAQAVATPEERRALIDALVIAACIETTVHADKERVVKSYATKLGVRSPWVELLPALRAGRVLAIKRALMSHSPDARRLFARTWSEGGVRGVLEAVSFALGLHRDAPLASRFRALSGLPNGTFGKAFFEHLDSRGLTFPGEKGGIPERMIHHDLMHVVNGYGTDPAGECEVAGFYAGHASRIGDPDWFTFFVIVLATFHLDLPVSPAVVTPARGAFDPLRVMPAFLRGRRMSTDVMGAWDYWSLFSITLEESRVRLGIEQPTVET
jgi:hypothetical protein